MKTTHIIQVGALAAGILVMPGEAAATVATYGAPPGLSPGDAAQQSTMYQVRVIQGGSTNESYVYQLQAPTGEAKSWRYNICSFTTFSFDGKVTVEVTKFSGAAIATASVHPVSYGIPATVVSGTKATFQLSRQNAKMAVIFNNDWKTHPLFIFAEELEVNLPPGPSANVIYYGPGVHNPGQITVTSGKTVYFSGGAYVKGWIDAGNVGNVKLIGRGMLSAESRPDNGTGTTSKTIRLDGSGNCEVNGIITAQNVGFGLDVGGANNLIKNYKHLGCWHPTTDGINMGDDSLVEDCFISANDDGIKCYQQNVIVRRIVFWQMENGACFQFGWGGASGTRRNIRISEIDVIRKDSDPAGGAQNRVNNSIISCVDGGSSTSYDWVFENIRCENVNGRLFSLEPATGVSIRDITIRNFSVANWNSSNFYNTFNSARVHDITFENLMVNGQLITQPAQADIRIQNGAYNIFFTQTNQDTNPPVVVVTSPTNGAAFAFAETVNISATVTDNVAVASAQLWVNGVLQSTDLNAPYAFTTALLAGGAHTLTVVGIDAAGNRASNSASITVANQTDFVSPSVTITTPTNSASFAYGLAIPVAAMVTDDIAVSSAELFVNEISAGTDTTAPFEFTVTGLAAGNHTLRVVARDTSYNSATNAVAVAVVGAAPEALTILSDTFDGSVQTGLAAPLNFLLNTAIDSGTNGSVLTPMIANNTTTPGSLVLAVSNSPPQPGNVDYDGAFAFSANGATPFDFGPYLAGGKWTLTFTARVSGPTAVDKFYVGVSDSSAQLSETGFDIAVQMGYGLSLADGQGLKLIANGNAKTNFPGATLLSGSIPHTYRLTVDETGVTPKYTLQFDGAGVLVSNTSFGAFANKSRYLIFDIFDRQATNTLNLGQLDSVILEAVPPTASTLQLHPTGGGQLQLQWNGTQFGLQVAPTVTGPWTNVVPATNPFLISPTGAANFYRLRWPSP